MCAFRFPAEMVEYLTDLRAHNDKAWFDANRARYESGYVEPAYVADGVGERLLRHSALYAHAELPAKTAISTRFIDTVLGHWRLFSRVHTWLVVNVQR